MHGESLFYAHVVALLSRTTFKSFTVHDAPLQAQAQGGAILGSTNNTFCANNVTDVTWRMTI